MSLKNRSTWQFLIFFFILCAELLILNLLGMMGLVSGFNFVLVYVLPFITLPITWWLTGKV